MTFVPRRLPPPLVLSRWLVLHRDRREACEAPIGSVRPCQAEGDGAGHAEDGRFGAGADQPSEARGKERMTGGAREERVLARP